MARKSKYQPMRFHAPRHPSGRPRRRLEQVSQPIWRIPADEPATPRLRLREQMPAIGFTVGRLPGSDDDEFE